MLKFFYAPNTCALASHIALRQAGAEFEPVRVSFADNQQRSPEYLAVNPKGRVPALATGEGILTETPAILAWIAQAWPQAKLAPVGDPWAFAQVQSFNAYICATVHVAHAHRMRGYRWASEESSFADMRRKVPQSVGDCFRLIEREMLNGPWVMGDAYTVCDPYLFTLAQWLEADGVPLEDLPRVLDHRRRMSELPAVHAAIQVETAR
jgi:glutathione S-transferase